MTNPVDDLIKDDNQILALQEDMEKNPANAKKDILAMLQLLSSMESILAEMPHGLDAVKKDCAELQKYLKELQSDPKNPQILNDVEIIEGNLRHDLLQG